MDFSQPLEKSYVRRTLKKEQSAVRFCHLCDDAVHVYRTTGKYSNKSVFQH